MEFLLYFIVFFLLVGLIMLAFGVRESRESKRDGAVAKLQRIREMRGNLAMMGLEDEINRDLQKKFARDEEKRAVEKKKERSQAMKKLDVLARSIGITNRLDQNLQQINSLWHASELIIGALGLGVLLLLIFTLLGWGWYSLIPALGCVPLPWLYVKSLRVRYYRKFDEQLSDTLMLMSNSLRAGFSFLQSLEMVAREAPFPISQEFTLVTQEIAVGVSITQALDNLSARIGSSDLDLMVTAVIIQRETGGALAEILDIIAGVIGERMRIKREIRTLTAQGRLTGFVLGMLPVFLGLAIHLISRMSSPNEPSFVEPLLHETVGQMMLIGGVVMQMIGIMWIMKIVTIKV